MTRARRMLTILLPAALPLYFGLSIGCSLWQDGLVETSDDWSCATFWYEPVPSSPLPELADAEARTRDLQAE